jgi:hypothetical protein
VFNARLGFLPARKRNLVLRKKRSLVKSRVVSQVVMVSLTSIRVDALLAKRMLSTPGVRVHSQFVRIESESVNPVTRFGRRITRTI